MLVRVHRCIHLYEALVSVCVCRCTHLRNWVRGQSASRRRRRGGTGTRRLPPAGGRLDEVEPFLADIRDDTWSRRPPRHRRCRQPSTSPLLAAAASGWRIGQLHTQMQTSTSGNVRRLQPAQSKRPQPSRNESRTWVPVTENQGNILCWPFSKKCISLHDECKLKRYFFKD